MDLWVIMMKIILISSNKVTVSVKDKQQKAVLKVSLCIYRHISQEHLATSF